MSNLSTIHPVNAKFIKLGGGGEWAQACFDQNILVLGFEPESVSFGGDLGKVTALHLKKEQQNNTSNKTDKGKKQSASNAARQTYDFHANEETLWITFHNGYLYWCFAEGEVFPLDEEQKKIFTGGTRFRSTRSGWKRTNIQTKELKERELRGSLTHISGFRGTICSVKGDNKDEKSDFYYLCKKINAEKLPIVEKAKKRKCAFLDSIQEMQKQLQPKDLELLVELVFNQSGWRRVGAIGKTQKFSDLDLILPSTGQSAIVQVKSKTSKKEMEDYIKDFDKRGEHYFFYVYHTCAEDLLSIPQEDKRVHVWDGKKLAEQVMDAGLFNWILNKIN